MEPVRYLVALHQVIILCGLLRNSEGVPAFPHHCGSSAGNRLRIAFVNVYIGDMGGHVIWVLLVAGYGDESEEPEPFGRFGVFGGSKAVFEI